MGMQVPGIQAGPAGYGQLPQQFTQRPQMPPGGAIGLPQVAYNAMPQAPTGVMPPNPYPVPFGQRPIGEPTPGQLEQPTPTGNQLDDLTLKWQPGGGIPGFGPQGWGDVLQSLGMPPTGMAPHDGAMPPAGPPPQPGGDVMRGGPPSQTAPSPPPAPAPVSQFQRDMAAAGKWRGGARFGKPATRPDQGPNLQPGTMATYGKPTDPVQPVTAISSATPNAQLAKRRPGGGGGLIGQARSAGGADYQY